MSYPRSDISENSEGLRIEISLPGLSQEDVTVEFVGSSIVVSGMHSERDKYARYTTKELYRCGFSGTYPIYLKKYDINNVKCDMVNGLLTIKVPFANYSESVPVRKLEINNDDKGE